MDHLLCQDITLCDVQEDPCLALNMTDTVPHVFEYLVVSCWHSLSERLVEPLGGGALLK